MKTLKVPEIQTGKQMICSASEEAQDCQRPRTPKQTQGLILGTGAKLNVSFKKNVMSMINICVWGNYCNGLTNTLEKSKC